VDSWRIVALVAGLALACLGAAGVALNMRRLEATRAEGRSAKGFGTLVDVVVWVGAVLCIVIGILMALLIMGQPVNRD